MQDNKSLYKIISTALVNGELPKDFSLPVPETEEDEILFADGAEDGIYLYHMMPEEVKEDAYNKMVEAIHCANNQEYVNATLLFEDLSETTRTVTMWDTMQDYIVEHKEELNSMHLYKYAEELITTTKMKECVKYGLCILGLISIQDEKLKEVIRTLGLSDEFTLFCALVMKNWKDGNKEVYELAKKVHGWGRIHAIERFQPLLPDYDEMREWLLKEGINNTVLPDYSAGTVWKKSGAGSILFTHPTYEQFICIRKIINALLPEEAIIGLSQFDKRKEIILVFLKEAEKMPLEYEDYAVIGNIYHYFEEVSESEEILDTCKKLLSTEYAQQKTLGRIIL